MRKVIIALLAVCAVAPLSASPFRKKCVERSRVLPKNIVGSSWTVKNKICYVADMRRQLRLKERLEQDIVHLARAIAVLVPHHLAPRAPHRRAELVRLQVKLQANKSALEVITKAIAHAGSTGYTFTSADGSRCSFFPKSGTRGVGVVGCIDPEDKASLTGATAVCAVVPAPAGQHVGSYKNPKYHPGLLGQRNRCQVYMMLK